MDTISRPTATKTKAYTGTNSVFVSMAYEASSLLTDTERAFLGAGGINKNALVGSDRFSFSATLQRMEYSADSKGGQSFKFRLLNPTEQLETALFEYLSLLHQKPIEDFKDIVFGTPITAAQKGAIPLLYVRWGYGTSIEEGISSIHKVRLVKTRYMLDTGADRVIELVCVDSFSFFSGDDFVSRNEVETVSIVETEVGGFSFRPMRDILNELVSNYARLVPGTNIVTKIIDQADFIEGMVANTAHALALNSLKDPVYQPRSGGLFPAQQPAAFSTTTGGDKKELEDLVANTNGGEIPKVTFSKEQFGSTTINTFIKAYEVVFNALGLSVELTYKDNLGENTVLNAIKAVPRQQVVANFFETPTESQASLEEIAKRAIKVDLAVEFPDGLEYYLPVYFPKTKKNPKASIKYVDRDGWPIAVATIVLHPGLTPRNTSLVKPKDFVSGQAVDDEFIKDYNRKSRRHIMSFYELENYYLAPEVLKNYRIHSAINYYASIYGCKNIKCPVRIPVFENAWKEYRGLLPRVPITAYSTHGSRKNLDSTYPWLANWEPLVYPLVDASVSGTSNFLVENFLLQPPTTGFLEFGIGNEIKQWRDSRYAVKTLDLYPTPYTLTKLSDLVARIRLEVDDKLRKLIIATPSIAPSLEFQVLAGVIQPPKVTQIDFTVALRTERSADTLTKRYNIRETLFNFIETLNSICTGVESKLVIKIYDFASYEGEGFDALVESLFDGTISPKELNIIKSEKPVYLFIGTGTAIPGFRLDSTRKVYSFPEITFAENSDVLTLEYGTQDSIIADIKFEGDTRYLTNLTNTYHSIRNTHIPQSILDGTFNIKKVIFSAFVPLQKKLNPFDPFKLKLESLLRKLPRQKNTLEADYFSLFPYAAQSILNDVNQLGLPTATIEDIKFLAQIFNDTAARDTLFPAIGGGIKSYRLVDSGQGPKLEFEEFEQKELSRRIDFGLPAHIDIGDGNSVTLAKLLTDIKWNTYLRQSEEIWSLDLTILGIPEIDQLPYEIGSRIIHLKVFDSRLAGNHEFHWLSGFYKIKSFSHIIDTSVGYLTTLSLYRSLTLNMSNPTF